MHARGHRSTSKSHLPIVGHFYSVLFVVTLDFFICLVYVAGFVILVLSYLSHPYPLLWRSLCNLSRFLCITLVVQEMMNLTVKSSLAGLRSNPLRLLYPPLSFPSVPYGTHSTHLRHCGYISSSFMSTYFSTSPPIFSLSGLPHRSSKPPLYVFPTIFF